MAKKLKQKKHVPTQAQEPIQKNYSMALDADKPQENITKKMVRLQIDIEYGGTRGKEMDNKSQTVPDLNLTVRQLLENHSRDPLSGAQEVRQPLYFETELPSINDITDVEAYREALEERLANTKKFIENEIKEKEQKAAEEIQKQETAAKIATVVEPGGQTAIKAE